MQISFHGAAQTVTGSKHIISLKNGKKILLDCGMFQGKGSDSDILNRNWGFDPAEIDYFVLSHAHIDHTGLIPKLVNDGFKGAIHCTPATKDITTILLEDSASIQEQDIRFLNKKRLAQGQAPLQPLYDDNDVATAMKRFVVHPYQQSFKLDDNIEVSFSDAGHILGSAVVSLKIKESGEIKRICFSGDVGRYRNRILSSPQHAPQADIIICESTYGDKLHDDIDFSENEMLHAVTKTCLQKRGKLIIPAFSVGRTQEVLFVLNKLHEKGLLPDIEVFVDSPLSVKATELVKRHPELFNRSVQKMMESDNDPFSFSGLKLVTDKATSQRLNDRTEPCVIISASGMAEAGRVKHHIFHNIHDERNTILFIGYAERNSLGGRLQSGAKLVTIFGEPCTVKAEIMALHSFSAHGDYEDLCEFLGNQNPKDVERFFVVHGEPEVQTEFGRRMYKKGFQDVRVPNMHESFYI